MRDLFLKDLGWKIFSLLLAAFIWVTVHKLIEEPRFGAGAAAGIPVIYGELPVAIVAAKADMRDYRLLQSTVTVTVSGPAEIIGKLQANQIHATVDLSDTNTDYSKNQRVDVAVPAGVTVVSVKPDSLGVIAPPPKH